MQLMKTTITIVTAMALFSLTGCANNKFQRAQVARTAQTQMIGMSRHDLLMCAGVPIREVKDGNTDFMAYSGGGDSTGVAAGVRNGAVGTAVVSSKHRYCEVTFALEEDKVVKVEYTGRTGGYATSGEQCAFVVANCVK
jgi:hypothetical protein